MGFFKLDPASLNNRNGFAWMVPCSSVERFLAMDFRPLAEAGLVGIAVWITDAQWVMNAGITDVQWQRRALIDREFTASWPAGRRAAE